MGLHPSLVRRVVLLVLLALIGVRTSDAHLHMCLDGQEAPVTVHVADASLHHDADHEGQEHDDRDVDPVDAALLKAEADVDLLVYAVTSFVIAFSPLAVHEPSAELALPNLTSPLYLRPPSRGPPV